jgi:hypothetical protein
MLCGSVESVDECLAARGVPVRMEKLVFGESPVKLPERDADRLVVE